MIGEIRINSTQRNHGTLRVPSQILETGPGQGGNLVRLNQSGNCFSLHDDSNTEFKSTKHVKYDGSGRAVS